MNNYQEVIWDSVFVMVRCLYNIVKKLLFIFCLVLALGSFFPEQIVFAQGDGEPGLVQLSQCSGTDCSACNIVHLANGGIKWLIGILFVIFALLIAVAGVRLVMSGGNHSALDEAKSMFMNAIIGFIIILSAWLIVDTIMRALVGTEGRPGQLVAKGTATGYLFWSDVQCQVLDTPEDKGQETLEFKRAIAEYRNESSSDAGLVIPNPTGYPSGGTGTGANCPAAPEGSVVPIPGTSYKARSSVRDNFVAMRTAAARDGVTLQVNSGWRSEAVQVGIWNSHNCNVRSCSGTVARPCTLGGNGSNHNSGNALDLQSRRGSDAYNWLKANGGRYGFNNNLGADDPFHWSPSGR